ncbi:AP-5 complex subunit sigma-1 isoform X1 [Lontra canadensis]|uniref:AP-5 complex subunit sigma-1 isoform X1 n=2 Tax=Lontra canadensis TaxID=76717 RepID=UPI0013F3459C|nr:AP-5 complex subunit sigma-1 isoform X1 [Lontra canadensis]
MPQDVDLFTADCSKKTVGYGTEEPGLGLSEISSPVDSVVDRSAADQTPLFRVSTLAMVHAFLIHTLRAPQAQDPGLCRVLYSCVFGAENSPDDPRPRGAERDRLLQKEQILAVARQVDSMCQLQQQASGRTPMDLQPQSSDEPVHLHEAPLGAFRLAAGDPFQEPRTVVWLGVLSLGFALVLDAHENLLLAEGTLRLLARLLLDHLRLLTPSTNLLLRADRIEGILARFLPHGQLLFLNDQFVQGLEKEFSAAWPR